MFPYFIPTRSMSGEKNPYLTPELEAAMKDSVGRNNDQMDEEAVFPEGASEAAPAEGIENVMDDTREALKVPMGPVEAPAPIVGDDETADKYGEGDGARENGQLIPGYPGDAR